MSIALVGGGFGVAGQSAAALRSPQTDIPEETTQVWQPFAYGAGEISTPATWPVVYPGTSECGDTLLQGVVLLGAFGSSSWCGSGSASATARPLANVVRLAPLTTPTSTFRGDPSTMIDGTRVYTSVLHGPISGTVYFDPLLGIELMAVGPLGERVVDSLAPSPRQEVLERRTTASVPQGWRTVTFAGVRVEVPASWPVSRSSLSFSCEPIDTAMSAPSLDLDTDATDNEGQSCPYIPPVRLGSNGVRIDAGSAVAPNRLPTSSQHFVEGGLQMYVDEEYPFSVLVVDIELHGRAMPVEVRIGLGTTKTAAAILRSIRAA
jgi:hypothetical protein